MNELVISKNKTGLRIALLKDKTLIELHHEKLKEEFVVGDLVLGKVKKIVGGLNAAFVDVGHPRDAFLHYLDLGPQVKTLIRYVKAARQSRQPDKTYLSNIKSLPDINKHGKMSEIFRSGNEILVQVVKEPISTKGPRLSSEISLPGQYMVLVPFSQVISISKKIRSRDEKRRLKILAESLKPKNFGIIMRTAAEGKDAATLSSDIMSILSKWEKMTHNLNKSRAPLKVLSEQNRATSILRDMMSEGFDYIHTDDQEVHDSIRDYLLQLNQPKMLKNLKLYGGKQISLFQHLNLEKQIKGAFGKVVSMSNSTYLVIEHTEAMHVIDVNSGSKNLSNESLEATALRTNLIAAKEIARQLRLRDMGGIIVVDFIDMRQSENRRKLNEEFRAAMKDDRARHSILPVSRFGLIQITRQRVRPQLKISTNENCPSCNGSGKIQAAVLIDEQINENIEFLIRQNNEKNMSLVVNPYLTAYLTKGPFKSPQWKWFFKYGKWIKIISDNAMPFTRVKYINSAGEEIKL